jgi:MraZ protein
MVDYSCPVMVPETNIASKLSETPQLTYDGQFNHGLDDKRRVQIPAKWRPASGEMVWKALLWPRQDLQGHYLVVVSAAAHASIMARLSANSMADERGLKVLRFFSRNSGDLVMDKAGRVCIPDNLAKGAGIEKDAVLVGMWDRFEIWSAERFNQTVASEDASVAMELGKYFGNTTPAL